MPKKKLSAEYKARKKRQLQQQRVKIMAESEVVQIETSTKKVVPIKKTLNLLKLKKVQKFVNKPQQQQSNQNDELIKIQSKNLTNYIGKKFTDINERITSLEEKLDAFISSAQQMLVNPDYKKKLKILEIIEKWNFKQNQKNILKQQINTLEKPEFDCLDIHFTHPNLNKWFQDLQFIQFALYIVVLEEQGSAKNTIKNNANSLRKISRLLIEQNIQVLTYRDHYKIRKFILDKNQYVNTLSTIRGNLQDYCAALKYVCGKQIKIKVGYRELGERNPLINIDDIMGVIKYYKSQKDERLQLLSLFLYLLALTGARNESIRTAKFDQFIIRNEGQVDEEFALQIYASKTGIASEHPITSDVYKFVQQVQVKRLEAMNNIMQKRGDKITQYEQILIDRRREHLFTFYSQASLHLHIKRMKLQFKDIKNMNKFIVHNIRTLRLIQIFQSKGLKAAQLFAGHTSELTTLQHYLLKSETKKDMMFNWAQAADNLEVKDMEHFDDKLRKDDYFKDDDDAENVDDKDLLQIQIKKKKQEQEESKGKEKINDDDDEDDEDEQAVLGIVIDN